MPRNFRVSEKLLGLPFRFDVSSFVHQSGVGWGRQEPRPWAGQSSLPTRRFQLHLSLGFLAAALMDVVGFLSVDMVGMIPRLGENAVVTISPYCRPRGLA